MNAWEVGMRAVPDAWTSLRSLRNLQLRGHTMLLVRAHLHTVCCDPCPVTGQSGKQLCG